MLNRHKKQWEFFKKKFEQNQLSHAYLFSGEKGIGKESFAIELIKMVNCSIKENVPCQKCFSCQAIERNGFPDFKIVEAEEGAAPPRGASLAPSGREIKIAQVREAQKFLNYKAYYGGYKAVIVDGAEALNTEAQNCFLKTLEEPKGKTLLFLITSRPDMLLSTITSRCQPLKFFRPKGLGFSPEQVDRENKISKDLERMAASGLSEKFKYVKAIDFTNQDPREILTVFQKYFRKQLLNNFADKKALKALEMSEEINNKLTFTNANPKLALEVLLMEL